MIFFRVSFKENERITGLSVFLSVKRYFRSLPKLPKANDENEKMMIRDDEFMVDDVLRCTTRSSRFRSSSSFIIHASIVVFIINHAFLCF